MTQYYVIRTLPILFPLFSFIYLFIYGSLKSAICFSGYAESNDRMTRELEATINLQAIAMVLIIAVIVSMGDGKP